MFDNITLKINDLPQNFIFCKRVKNSYQNDTNTYRGNLKNMGIYQNHNRLTIRGSLAKYLRGENITPLNREGVKQAVEALEQEINLCLKTAIVCSVEFGTSIIVNEKPFEYLSLFGYINRLKKAEFSEWTGIETVNYFSPTGSYGFIGYDKIKEMQDTNQDIPPLFDKTNVLRLEYKIRKKKGIEEQFKGGLSAYNLFDEVIYLRFKELFHDTYKNIDKMGQLVYAVKSKSIVPSKFVKLQAEQYRQCFPKDFRFSIQQLKEGGKLSTKNLERIRAGNRKLERDIYISEQNALIEELNALVKLSLWD